MSIRAYKVIKVELEETPTFNLWSDTKVMESLAGEGCTDTLSDGAGTMYIEKETIKLLLKEADTDREKEVYKQMLEDCGSRGTSVEYECY